MILNLAPSSFCFQNNFYLLPLAAINTKRSKTKDFMIYMLGLQLGTHFFLMLYRWGPWVFGGLLHRGTNKQFSWPCEQVKNKLAENTVTILISLIPFLWHYIVPQESLQIFFCGMPGNTWLVVHGDMWSTCAQRPFRPVLSIPFCGLDLDSYIVMCILKKQMGGKKKKDRTLYQNQTFSLYASSWGVDKKTNSRWLTITTLLNTFMAIS